MKAVFFFYFSLPETIVQWIYHWFGVYHICLLRDISPYATVLWNVYSSCSEPVLNEIVTKTNSGSEHHFCHPRQTQALFPSRPVWTGKHKLHNCISESYIVKANMSLAYNATDISSGRYKQWWLSSSSELMPLPKVTLILRWVPARVWLRLRWLP